MDERRILRVSEAVREELIELIGFEMADPRLLPVEVSHVHVSPDGRHQRPLPQILVVDLGHRHIEFVAQAVFQALDDLTLVFQRVRILHSYLQSQYSDRSHLDEEFPCNLFG